MLLLLLPPYFLVLDNKTYANVAHPLLEKLALPINVHTQTPTVTARQTQFHLCMHNTNSFILSQVSTKIECMQTLLLLGGRETISNRPSVQWKRRINMVKKSR